ncbi:MAG: Gfo/Idh/MocA family protein [Kiritimatiellia bacterium]
MNTIQVGLFGANGHQLVSTQLVGNGRAVCRGFAGFVRDRLPLELRNEVAVRDYGTLDALLADPAIDLVSLCSPRRDEQARDAIRCLEAGKHVYAEKPCALTESDLDAILALAAGRGLKFHEMAGSAFEQPYREMGRLVRGGTLGTIIQVWAQKSYPWFQSRPQDEGLDGGLLMQVGVHAVRYIEHVTGLQTAAVSALETKLGNPDLAGECRRAAQMMMRLSNGGLASAVVNYLNPHESFGSWGNEHLRIFGTRGFIESTDAGSRTRLVLDERDCGALKPAEPSLDWFECFLDELTGTGGFPIPLAEELHPTRVVIRAKASMK